MGRLGHDAACHLVAKQPHRVVTRTHELDSSLNTGSNMVSYAEGTILTQLSESYNHTVLQIRIICPDQDLY